MISTEKILNDIEQKQSQAKALISDRMTATKADYKHAAKISKSISHLRMILKYAETNPSEASIKKQIEILEKRLERVNMALATIPGADQKARSARISEIKKHENYNLMRTQLETLKFILES